MEMVKIIRKSLKNHEAQLPKLNVFVRQKRHFVIIIFKMLKMEFKFEHQRVIKKGQPILSRLFQ